MSASEESAGDVPVPRGWATARVAEIVEHAQSGFASGEKGVPNGIRHLRMNNVGEEGELVLDLLRTVPLDLALEHHFLHVGDVLVCTTNSGKLVGKCALFRLNGAYAFSNHLTRLRPIPSAVDSAYLRWCLWQAWKTGQYESQCQHWVNQSTLPKEALLATQIPLPPIAEQKRIMLKVEAVLARVNAARERLAKAPAILKRFRQAVLAAACSGRLTADWRAGRGRSTEDALARATVRDDLELFELPDSWGWASLRAVMDPSEAFCYGVVQPGANDPQGVFLVRASDLAGGTVDRSQLRRIPRDVDNSYRRSRLRGGELLITVVGAGIGEAAIAPAGCAGFNIARAVAKVPVREASAHYVLRWLQGQTARSWMGGDAREVARPTLNLEQLQTLPVPLPPRAEQDEINRRVDALFVVADKAAARISAATARAEAITQAVLSKAFRGELVETEAELAAREGREFESAQQLLERIRAARAAASPAPRRQPRRQRTGSRST